MANNRANPSGWSHGEKLTAAEANIIDQGQARAWVNNGTTTLTNNSDVDLDGYTLTLAGGTTTISALSVGAYPSVTSQTVTDYAPPVSWQYDNSEWKGYVNGSLSTTPATSNSLELSMRCSGTSAESLVGLLALPVGMVVTAVSVRARNASSAALPAGMPAMWLMVGSASGAGTLVTKGYALDASASNAAYAAWHDISITGLSYTVAQSDVIYLVVKNSSSTNSVANLQIYRPRVSGTIDTLRVALCRSPGSSSRQLFQTPRSRRRALRRVSRRVSFAST